MRLRSTFIGVTLSALACSSAPVPAPTDHSLELTARNVSAPHHPLPEKNMPRRELVLTATLLSSLALSPLAAAQPLTAVAVANWRFSTADMAAAAKETPGFADAPHVVTVPGGIPVFSADGQQFIGAVGVSGEAPTDDAACAEAGVRSAGLSTTRKQS